MQKTVTVKDIASRMGISMSTVNKALTGKSGVSEERRAEVVAVAKEMGYVVNHVAQSLSRKPIRIGIVIPADWQHYFASVERGMQIQLDKLRESNVYGKIIHVNSTETIKEAFDSLYQEPVNIILYCPSLYGLPDDFKEYVSQKNVPVFLVGNEDSGLESVCTVSVNAGISGYMAADFLKLMIRENEQVAVFIGSRKMSAHMDKAEAFLKRAREIGLEPVEMYETFDDSQTVLRCLERMHMQYPDVKGIYVATATARPIVDFYNRASGISRPCIIATDVYEGICKDMEDRLVQATIFQNQVIMGRLAVKMAYQYIVNTSSYSETASEFSAHINVLPQLYLPSNVANVLQDDGQEYTLE